MGTVTGDTPRIPLSLQMGMYPLKLGEYIGVALKAFGGGAPTGMTGGALACAKGLVLQLPQQVILFARVRMVAFETVHIRSGAPHVFALPCRPGGVTRQTQLRAVAAQQPRGIAAVDCMTAGTFSAREGAVLFAGCLREAGMTGSTHLFLRVNEQTGLGTGVGRMTGGTFPLMHRCMAVTPLFPARTFIAMALAAQLRLFFQQQSRMA